MVLRGDVDAFKSNKDFAAKLTALGSLEASVGSQLHHGTTCPARLRATVKTCTAKVTN